MIGPYPHESPYAEAAARLREAIDTITNESPRP